MYKVFCEVPPAVYAGDFFPRGFRYKAEAMRFAKEVEKAGGLHVRVQCPDGSIVKTKPILQTGINGLLQRTPAEKLAFVKWFYNLENPTNELLADRIATTDFEMDIAQAFIAGYLA